MPSGSQKVSIDDQAVNGVTSRAYAVVAALLVILFSLSTLYGHWTGDFWEHAAVVKELAAHPIAPQHPLLLVQQQHAFFSPYSMSVALFARLTGMHAVDALAAAALTNLVLLLIGFRLFVRELIPGCGEVVPAYALLLTVFFWPSSTWGWSGFLHFGVLGHVLPYPSTFAIAVTFLFLVIVKRALIQRGLLLLIAAIVLQATIVLTHPTTAVFAVIGVSALTMQRFRFTCFRAALTGSAIVLAGFALAMLWPYFSVVDLLTYNAPGFHEDSRIFYEAPWKKALPALITLPFVAIVLKERIGDDVFDALALMLAGTLLVYGLGYWTGQYGIGRIIFFVVCLIFILFAVYLERLQKRVEEGSWKSGMFLASVMVLALIFNWGKFEIAAHRAILASKGRTVSYQFWRDLSDLVDPYEVVLADPETGWRVPAFSGKVVASKHPIHWVESGDKRRLDVEQFFSSQTNRQQREVIIRRWRVDYLLIDTEKGQREDVFQQFGPVILKSQNLQLIALNR